MVKSKFKTGAKASPRHALAAARPYMGLGAAPAAWVRLPKKKSMWGNDVDGDCVTAEEAAAKAATGVLIGDDEVKRWATAHGVTNGAYLNEVLDWMNQSGFKQDGNTYNDGAKQAIDYTNYQLLCNALYQGPVKLGVAAGQLQNVAGTTDGWFGLGFEQDQNLDHCISGFGYGTIAWLAQQIAAWYGVPSVVPSGVDGSKPGIAVFTWNTVGVLDFPSFLAIVGEAWYRTPTTVTVGSGVPTPDLVFTPDGPPPPPPPPSPNKVLSLTFAHDVPPHSRVDFVNTVRIPKGKFDLVHSASGEVYHASTE